MAVENPPYEIEFYEDELGNEPALAFMRSLEGVKKRAIGVAITEVLQHLGPDVAEGNFGRNLGEGLYEFKLDQNAEQILRRMVFPTYGWLVREHSMPTKFREFMREVETEAKADGPEAVEQLEAFRAHFRVGRQIAEARRARRLTQKQVAKIAHVDQADVSNIERGATNPTFAMLNAIVSAVGMEVDVRKRRAK